MALIALPYSFVPNTNIASAQVNANFNTLANYINAGSGNFIANGYAILPGGLYLQWGSAINVAADGSAPTVVTFPAPFPNACFQFVPAIQNAYQTNNWGLSVQYDTPTKTNANVNVALGPAASTTTVSWFAIGN